MQPDRTIDPYKLQFRRDDSYLCVGGAAHGQRHALRHGGSQLLVPVRPVNNIARFATEAELMAGPHIVQHRYAVRQIIDCYGDKRRYLIVTDIDDYTTYALLRDLGELESR